MKIQIRIKDTNLKGEIIGVHHIFNLYIVKLEDGTIKEVSPHLVIFNENS